jgi:LysM repeat protein
MRYFLVRFGCLLLLAGLATACQRNLVYLDTPEPVRPVGSDVPERSAALSELQGRVEVRTSSQAAWVTARDGQTLSEGAELRTGDGASVVVELTEGSRIYVSGGSEFSFEQLNAYLDSQLTRLGLRHGQVWVLLSGGALDVETPYGIAAARAAYLSVDFHPQARDLAVSCLQGVCGFGSTLIPGGYKLLDARTNTEPEPMSMSDYGAWGSRVPEAAQLAYLATQAGMATGTAESEATSTEAPPPTATATATALPASPSPTPTVPASPTPTLAPPTATATLTPAPATNTVAPSPTRQPTQPATARPTNTPLPPLPILGQHTVLAGETIFCIGRGYGVLPTAIAQANGISLNTSIRAGTRLNIPQVQWTNISAGPVCPPQFTSPYPGLPVVSASNTPSAPTLTLRLNSNCIFNCNSQEGDYIVNVQAIASGGVEPYSYVPGQNFDVTLPHCTNGSGSVTVTSGDGQTASAIWEHRDVSCPTP